MSRVLPILFNTDMVRAILDGRKTVTRRVVNMDISNQFDVEVDGSVICYIDQATGDSFAPEKICRYKPGDILYVRETWYRDEECILYKADNSNLIGYRNMNGKDVSVKWRPSIHMPKSAARIWLKVADVRVERLQDISEEQAKAEGVTYEQAGEAGYERWIPSWYDPDSGGEPWYAGAYVWIWNSTIKKPDLPSYGWEANPYVWVIEFERCEQPQEEK